MIISHLILLKMRNFSDKSCRENKKSHLVFSIFFFENFTVYEVMWKDIVVTERPQMAIRCMSFACLLTKATNTLRICNNYCLSKVRMVTRTPLSFTLKVQYIDSLVCHNKL